MNHYEVLYIINDTIEEAAKQAVVAGDANSAIDSGDNTTEIGEEGSISINGYTIDELYSVGDGKADIKMAHNYPNGKGILVWTDPNTPEFNEIKPDIVCSSLVDLKAILTSQKQRS